ncbi:MAG: hypothetical protein V1870_01005 [Candidatus Aenigmatarchaeota archaeon]
MARKNSKRLGNMVNEKDPWSDIRTVVLALAFVSALIIISLLSELFCCVI